MVSSRRYPFRLIALVLLVLGGTVMAITVSSPSPASAQGEELLTSDQEILEQPDEPFVRELSIPAGETIAAGLARQGVRDAALLAALAGGEFAKEATRRSREAKTLLLNETRSGEPRLLIMPIPDSEQGFVVRREEGSGFSVRRARLPLEHQTHVAAGLIRTNLFAATDAAGLPESIAAALADIFAKRINFHGNLRRGSRFKVIYESVHYNGIPVSDGKILAAEFEVGERLFTALRYAPNNGSEAYYTPEGMSLKQGFLRSPLEFSRVSSGFSEAREHPVFRDTRPHTGIDFAAPTGTPVHATGPGVVAFVGNQGGYGNLVILKHEKGISTLYGHLSAFAPGLKQGLKVQQGQLIALVGETGWATGPHLHYEYRINNVFQDPERVSMPEGPSLGGSQLSSFLARTAPVMALLEQDVPSGQALGD